MTDERKLNGIDFGPTYRDRCFCESADNCGVKDCPRRLTEADKEAIKRGNWMVATITVCEKFVFKKVFDIQENQ